MRHVRTALLLVPALVAGCASNPDRHTIAELRDVEPDMSEVRVENSLEQAMVGYRKFLEQAPKSSLTPEAMRRLADLKLEKEFGILGDGKLTELPAPEASAAAATEEAAPAGPSRASAIADHSESLADFERRASDGQRLPPPEGDVDAGLPGGKNASTAGPLEAIELYDQILATYPDYEHNDQVVYQKARALDELGRVDEAVGVMEQLIRDHPYSRHIDEVQFRRAEYFFTRKKYLDAEDAFSAVTKIGESSEYYELALYKLGWTFYKQELHEEALHEYIALLDYKVSNGYDFDHPEDEADERRMADTFRVISLSFSSLGGPESVAEHFAANGQRAYEDRVYSHLGEFYLEKLRYHDAAAAYKAFVERYPLHRASPHFSMRVVEIYEAGGFPKLVLESKKEFAATYGLESEYWRHFDVDDAPEVISYLKSNLKDLANHYHALYQQEDLGGERPANFREASRWYRAYLASFPEDPETPPINYRLADLLLENRDFGAAAREYERTAYDYPQHGQAAAAGYAAIYAHRENEKSAAGEAKAQARREAVTSTLRFVDVFPDHEHAAAVLGAAADDLYDMGDFALALATGRRLIDDYPEADPAVRRSAWAVVAHSSFETADYPDAEDAYGRVLEMTPAEDESRQDVVDNLAASIYKQGERANQEQDYRAAADHFLRIEKAAPTSDVRPAAEYDAAAALIQLEAWSEAASVLESLRKNHPDHELLQEVTKQLALVYRKEGELARAAGEYERVAGETEDAELRREALLLAGDLYDDSGLPDRALAAYQSYVDQFPEPIEAAVETRFKIAEMYEAKQDDESHRNELRRIIEIDRDAGDERTPRVRYLASKSALVLSEDLYRRFNEVELIQPFEKNLREKQRRMDAALAALSDLVDYEVGEVTAAATFYMAEIFLHFSRSLIESERPTGVEAGEMQDYEMALEEEAFPFEERAIDFHEKNLELMAAGVYNPWIEKSLAELADLVPGRYAKFEASSGWIESIDVYAYQPPHALVPSSPTTATAEPEPPVRAGDSAEADPSEAAPSTEPVEPGADHASDEVPASPAAAAPAEAPATADAPPAAPAEPAAADGGEGLPPSPPTTATDPEQSRVDGSAVPASAPDADPADRDDARPDADLVEGGA